MREIPRKLSLAVLTALLAGTAGCDSGPDPGPGTLTATVTSPNAAEGAAVLSIFGEGIGQISPVDGDVFSFRQTGDTVRVVVVNPEGGALRFAVAVADTTGTFGGVVLEVAGPDDELRGSLAGYSVEFGR